MGLRCEVVNLVRAELRDELVHPSCISDVPIVQVEVPSGDVLIVMKVIDAGSIEGARAAHQAVNLVPLLQQLLSHIGAILTGHTGDECALGFRHESLRVTDQGSPEPIGATLKP